MLDSSNPNLILSPTQIKIELEKSNPNPTQILKMIAQPLSNIGLGQPVQVAPLIYIYIGL